MEKKGAYITFKNMIMSNQGLFHLILQYDNKTSHFYQHISGTRVCEKSMNHGGTGIYFKQEKV